MSLNIPDNPKLLENRSLSDLQRELPESANPFLEESWMGAQAIANARRVFDFYTQLRILEKEAIPATALQLLDTWAAVWGIVRNPATRARGNAVATGTPGSVIPQSTQLRSSDGNLYSVANDVTIQPVTVQIDTMTSLGTTATVKLLNPASLYANQSVTIAGADQPEYNGTFEIFPIAIDEFTYTLPAPAASPATGTITAEWTSAPIEIQSLEFGQDQNLVANTPITFVTPLAGVDSKAFVDFGAIGGGSDIETDEELRTRLLDRIQNPVTLFNVAAIVNQCKRVSGVTDVWVQEITPAVGQVTVYFVRNNDANPIPEQSEVDTVKNELLKIKPAHVADQDVIVSAPVPAGATFIFTALTPDTPTMRQAIIDNLDALFRDEAEAGVALTEDDYRCAINSTIDPATAQSVESFTLSSPVGDIGGALNEYPVLDAVNFNIV